MDREIPPVLYVLSTFSGSMEPENAWMRPRRVIPSDGIALARKICDGYLGHGRILRLRNIQFSYPREDFGLRLQ
jgi:hypothetical protein